MDEFDIPADVRRLIASGLDSIEHVDVLLLVALTAPRCWSAVEVAAELRVDARVARRCLDDLTRTHVLACTTEGGRTGERYVFTNTASAVRGAVHWLDETYKLRPTVLLRAVYDRPRRVARSFADAFRLRPPGES